MQFLITTTSDSEAPRHVKVTATCMACSEQIKASTDGWRDVLRPSEFLEALHDHEDECPKHGGA